MLAVIRKTYGWNKKEDQVSISQLEEMTGLSRRTVIYSLQNLEAQRFIAVVRLRGRGNVNQINTVAFQKNYDLWVVQRKSPQWEKQLQNKREKYQHGVVQRKKGSSAENQQNVAENTSAEKQGSAENEQKIVQRNEKDSADSLHPQKILQKQITKDNIYIGILNHWNQQNIVIHKKLPDDMRTAIIRTLRSYEVEEIKAAITNYAEILHGEQYYFKHKWVLKDFLTRGLEKFMDLEIAKSNYLRKEVKHATTRNPRELPKTYTKPPDYPDL